MAKHRYYRIRYRLRGSKDRWTDMGIPYRSGRYAREKRYALSQLSPNYLFRVVSYHPSCVRRFWYKLAGYYE